MMDKQGVYEASESDLQGLTPQEYPSQGKLSCEAHLDKKKMSAQDIHESIMQK